MATSSYVPDHRIPFYAIPGHLQVKIAKQMEFGSFTNFEQSAKLAKKLSIRAKTPKSCDVSKINFEENGIFVFKDSKAEKCFDWMTVKERYDCPKFRITEIVKVMDLDVFMQAVDNGAFSGRGCSMTIMETLYDISLSDIIRYLDLFEVKRFAYPFRMPMEICIAKWKKFRELEDIHFTEKVQIPDFLLLEASSINLTWCNRLHFEKTINTFLKQWFSYDRKIWVLHIRNWAVQASVLFADLPVSLLGIWSRSNKLLSKTTQESWSQCCYLLRRGEESLWITIRRGKYFRAELVSDEAVMADTLMDSKFDDRLDGYCTYNHMQKACHIHGPNNACFCCVCQDKHNETVASEMTVLSNDSV